MMNTFGIRSVPPCSDCYEDGQCSMNCGPVAVARTEATLKQYVQDVRDAREKKAAAIFNEGLWP